MSFVWKGEQMKELLISLKGGLIVSCQALEHEPLYSPQGGIMPLMAKAAMEGGAVGIRANSPRDIKEIKAQVHLPIIGLYKVEYPGFEPDITPTMKEVEAVVSAGATIVAIDCTDRPRPDGLSLKEALTQVRHNYPQALIMADISTYQEGCLAEEYGADIISSTLNGYTPYTLNDKGEEPNYELVRQLSQTCTAPVFAEGGIHYPYQAEKMLEVGAWSIVVGGAITRPMEITQRFLEKMKGKKDE
jgi:N-acylglucosamine-6-phosphate 2-epimerase